MSDLLANGIGWLGAAAVLLAFGFVSFGRLSGKSPTYQLVNVVGAVLLIVHTAHYGAISSLFVNIVWTLVSVIALIRWALPREPKKRTVVSARFGHVNLIARDWRLLVDFYRSVFGCEVVPPERDYSGPELAAATGLTEPHLRGVHMRLPGFESTGPTLEIYSYDHVADSLRPEVNRPGFGHIAFSVDDVAGARDAFIQHGGAPMGEIVESVTAAGSRVTWCYCRDPEGNIVELQRWAN